jgi:hypothetical protein
MDIDPASSASTGMTCTWHAVKIRTDDPACPPEIEWRASASMLGA